MKLEKYRPIPFGAWKSKFKRLSVISPNKTVIDACIIPHVFMLEKFTENNCYNITDENQLYHNMIRYIYDFIIKKEELFYA